MPRFSNIDSNFHVLCRCFNFQQSQWTEQKWMLTFLVHWPGSGICIRVWHLCSGCKLAACHRTGTYEIVRYRPDGAWVVYGGLAHTSGAYRYHMLGRSCCEQCDYLRADYLVPN